jgi:hypothetical protein
VIKELVALIRLKCITGLYLVVDSCADALIGEICSPEFIPALFHMITNSLHPRWRLFVAYRNLLKYLFSQRSLREGLVEPSNYQLPWSTFLGSPWVPSLRRVVTNRWTYFLNRVGSFPGKAFLCRVGYLCGENYRDRGDASFLL